ncbi:pyridoxal-phosphate dependent enzyme [Conexibacter sp. CPCC 206217]|uniref:pyridoxal-phosphate dependent enzyme n=1 Tax=Conexibacter sp. CPCC 206217 TaxID=3064574 RepID=UPI00271C3F8D|nr:pyridoxal-phosphate dependent enzyme [Conexibacter sp. CPCC 206217]MDO8210338.1 pyridoxal-phosphate dependent enzyme [Conexibacter sp. CPCC 206217]
MSGPGIFRHGARLPVQAPAAAISLAEGDTPLVALSADSRIATGGAAVAVKCEFLNPTGSFKDRIAAVAATRAREHGRNGVVGMSSGNGGAAIAAYAARAGLPLTLFTVPGAPAAKLDQVRAHGAHVIELRGLGHDAAATARAAAELVRAAQVHGREPFVTARSYCPDAMAGARTIAYELAEQAPDATAVYAPIGGGGLFASIWHGYRELAAQLPGPLPRLVAVQPRGCPTVRRTLEGAGAQLEQPATTAISGLQVAVLFDDADVVAALDRTGGHLVEVDDDVVWDVQARLARRDGMLVEPAGAVALAGLEADVRAGRVGPGDRVVTIATGAGFKDAAAIRRLGGEAPLDAVELNDVERILETTGSML